MSDPTEDIATKISANAAQQFVDTYYDALNHRRGTLTSFYIKPTVANPLHPDISLNGNVVPTAADLQTLFEKQIPKAYYEVQLFDCHVLNLNYNVGAGETDLGPDSSGRKISLMVIVSGYVKYGEPREADMRGFTETVVLVPNFEVRGKGRTAKAGRNWLIQSQNFRLVL